MNSTLTRRDFLKLASMLSLTPFARALPGLQSGNNIQSGKSPNVIVFLFDAFSAFHLSMNGYQRQTTPNLDKFAERATVYHAHHSAGNYTTPSTASLFTGTYPWTHRALNLGSVVIKDIRSQNIFELLKGAYYQAAFVQNIFVDVLLYQLGEQLSRHIGLDSFGLYGNTIYNHLFPRDGVYGLKSYDEFLFKREEAHGSLFLSILDDLNTQIESRINFLKLEDIHPDGPPRQTNTDVYYSIGQVMDGVMGLLRELPPSSFTYLHYMAPHGPYRPERGYLGSFDDGWAPPPKKRHPLGLKVPVERLNSQRQSYDEFIANLDAEFGRMLDFLKQTGLLENSYIIVTSDHGELFERGVTGHSTPLVFEPLIRVPLIISAPGQLQHKDVYSLTSNIDLLPTMLHLANLPLPEWCEGQPLPGMGGEVDADRSIFVVEAKRNPARQPLRKATAAILKGPYKLIHYLGYRNIDEEYEFFDLSNDPEELSNQYHTHPMAKELQAELTLRMKEADQPYVRKSTN
jgi:arylsulfatase A-like enzyme